MWARKMQDQSRIAALSRHLASGDPQVGRSDIKLPSGKLRSDVPIKHGWQLSLQLDASCKRTDGSEAALATAISGGADMRVGTNFPHAEHIDPLSGFGDLIGEVAGFQVGLAVALSLCAAAHPLPTIFAKIIGTSLSEATMRPNPTFRSRTSSGPKARSHGWRAR
jgi:hypothetical protein